MTNNKYQRRKNKYIGFTTIIQKLKRKRLHTRVQILALYGQSEASKIGQIMLHLRYVYSPDSDHKVTILYSANISYFLLVNF